MPRTVDFGRFHQIIRQANVELAQHEDGRCIEKVRQDNSPKIVVQTYSFKENKARNNGNFGRHHHGCQEHGKHHVFALEFDLGKSVGSHGGDHQLAGCADQCNECRVAVCTEHAYFGIRPHDGKVIPLPHGRQPVPVDCEHLVGALESRGDHPEHRQQEQQGKDPQQNGFDGSPHQFVPFHTFVPPLNSGPISSGRQS